MGDLLNIRPRPPKRSRSTTASAGRTALARGAAAAQVVALAKGMARAWQAVLTRGTAAAKGIAITAGKFPAPIGAFTLGAALILGGAPASQAESYAEVSGQLSGWIAGRRHQNDNFYHTGVRYIPGLDLEYTPGELIRLGFDLSLNSFAVKGSGASPKMELELYRLKLRLTSDQTEMRFGLQKINFGPGYLLRSLRWFDRMDPRDPQKLTEGVYGVRFVYSAMNNASLWLWALYGNDEPKGYEALPTPGDEAEFGGRLQLPVPAGEAALSCHTRMVDGSLHRLGKFRENRLALDGRWDVGIGIWFESVLQRQHSDLIPCPWMKYLTLGADYTVPLGQGLYCLFEHLALVRSSELSGRDGDNNFTAWHLNYPLGILDLVSAIGYFSWDEEKYAQYLAWQRTWDSVVLNINLFYYPSSGGDNYMLNRNLPGSGYGGQLTAMFNH
ncbi:MAG: hypothetical protein JXB45_08485 [Candidatus Krumholzibacteriota bacterium]|nr:hypothetical protein [Candidatus Krumholzibacteriota bacterium]